MKKLIQWSIDHHWLVIGLSVVLLAAGAWTARDMPVDVFPDLTAPTVTITFPLDGQEFAAGASFAVMVDADVEREQERRHRRVGHGPDLRDAERQLRHRALRAASRAVASRSAKNRSICCHASLPPSKPFQLRRTSPVSA